MNHPRPLISPWPASISAAPAVADAYQAAGQIPIDALRRVTVCPDAVRDSKINAANMMNDRSFPVLAAAAAALFIGSLRQIQGCSMRPRWFCVYVFLVAGLLVPFFGTGNAHAAVIANWDKSSRSWNNSHMTKIKAAMENAGHRVDADGAISSAALNISSVYVIGEPTVTPNAAELALLLQFVKDGGMIFVFGDTGIDLTTYNNLLAGLGSTMSYTTTTITTTGPMAGGQFTQTPWKISGNTLTVSAGNGIAAGSMIDNNYVRYEQIGNGYVVVFGDRIDHDDVISDTNTKLMLNLVSFAIVRTVQIPAASATGLVLTSLVLVGLGILQFARRRRCVY
jgi:hypothetical protein